MFVTNCISTTKIQKISEITNFFRHYFLSRTEVEFYLYERPWSMILGTPVKAWDNRLPFMMLPQHPNAYYAAMCLYNMVDNNTEMKKHKIPKIAYGKESC